MDQGHREVPTPELRLHRFDVPTVKGKQLVGSRISDDQGPLGRVPPLPQISRMTPPPCRELDRIEGEFENGGDPRDCEPRYADSLAGSIYLVLIAEAERMPCKHCTWLRVG